MHKEGSKPIFVSVGHMVSLESAIKIVMHTSKMPNSRADPASSQVSDDREKQVDF